MVCDECGQYIQSYTYYYYEKQSVASSMPKIYEYFCDPTCYAELLPTERFKVPFNKIFRKELPERERQTYWKHTETGVKSLTVPY